MIASTCINNGKSSKETIPLSASFLTALAVLVEITIDSNVTPCNSAIASSKESPRPNKVPILRVLPPKIVTYKSPAP